MNKNYFRLFIATLVLMPVLLYLLGTQVLFSPTSEGFLLTFYTLASIIAYFVSVGLLASCVWQPQAVDFVTVTEDSKPPKFIANIMIAVTILILGSIVTKRSVFVYNTSTSITRNYEQKTTERKGYYDAMWKSYKQQFDIAGINKDIFVSVVKIQMDARKDGPAASWKWVQENTQINHETYSKFYETLAQFITTQRLGYKILEDECQTLAKNHNLLIDTFPNNVYNVILNRPHIVYKYGFLSDSTNAIFASGIENLK